MAGVQPCPLPIYAFLTKTGRAIERRGVVMFVMIVPSSFSRVGADGVRSARVNVLLASGRVSAARQEKLLLDDVRHARAGGELHRSDRNEVHDAVRVEDV